MLEKLVLENGTKILFAPNSATQAATVLVIFGVGSRYEKASENGLSHYLEHLFFKGTKNRPSTFAIARELDGFGASYNAFTAEEFTGYFIECEKSHLEKALEIIADLLTNPLFQPEELEREKNVIIEEINMYEDFPQRYVLELAKLGMFGNTPLGRDIAGTKELVQKFSREDVVNYKNTHYHAENMHIVLTGNFQKEKIQKLLEKYFAQVKKQIKPELVKAELIYSKPKVTLKFKKTDQAHLVLGFPGVAFNNPEKIPLDLLATLLGEGMSSRLFTEIRERRGLGYYVQAESVNFQDSGMFFAHAGIKLDSVAEALKIILQEFDKIQKGQIENEELQKIKNQIQGKLALELEKSQEMAMFLGEQSIYTDKVWNLQEFEQKIQSISLTELKKVAQKIILPKLLNLAIIGPYQEKTQFEKIIQNRSKN